MISPQQLECAYDAILSRIDEAERSESADAWLALYEEWNELEIEASSDMCRIVFDYRRNMSDPDARDAQTMLDEELSPIGQRATEHFNRALLSSRHLEAVLDRYGLRLGDLLRMSLDPLAPVNHDLGQEEQRIVTEYLQAMGSAVVEIDGQETPLMKAMALLGSDDRDLRRKGFDALAGWLQTVCQEFESMFDRLVSIRQSMATNLGNRDFVRLGYLRMERDQYDAEQVELLSEAILRYTHPLDQALDRRHAGLLGLERLRSYDCGFNPEFDVPLGAIDVDREEAYLEEVLEKVSPRFGEHFRMMLRGGVVDIEGRRDKFVGAFAVPFAREKLAGICSQATGSANDMRALLHESGHCMQMIESMPIHTMALRSPTHDCAEIHSIGMEFLSTRHAGVFLEPIEAERYSRNQWRAGISTLGSVARADLFQHWVYRNPGAGTEDRHDAWSEILVRYPSDIDHSGYEAYRHRSWLLVSHLFASPFYMIDYAVAQVVAMQLAMIDAVDHERAVEMYIHLCRMGGTKGLNDLVDDIGLRSPFDPSLVRDLVAHAATMLGVDPSIIPQ